MRTRARFTLNNNFTINIVYIYQDRIHSSRWRVPFVRTGQVKRARLGLRIHKIIVKSIWILTDLTSYVYRHGLVARAAASTGRTRAGLRDPTMRPNIVNTPHTIQKIHPSDGLHVTLILVCSPLGRAGLDRWKILGREQIYEAVW